MPETVDPRQTALLVMDVQPAILSQIGDPDGFVDRARTAIDVARKAGATVGYVRVAFTDADRAAVPATNKAFSALAGGGAMAADAPDSQVDPRIAPADGDVVVRKVRVGGMSTTDLDAQLRTRGVTTLVLAGISTSGVVLSTVRDAADKDYRLFVLSDVCADRDPEVHRVLLEKVFPRQADVITSADLPALFG